MRWQISEDNTQYFINFFTNKPYIPKGYNQLFVHVNQNIEPMKTLHLMVCFLMTSIFGSFNQNTTIVEAIYDGHEDYGYNFIAKHPDNDEEYTITFQDVSDAVAKEFDLDSETLIGTKFKITYTTKTVVTKDEDNYEDENEINTITKLEKL